MAADEMWSSDDDDDDDVAALALESAVEKEAMAPGAWAVGFARDWLRLYPGNEGPLALTPRMAMKLNIAAVVLAAQAREESSSSEATLLAAISAHIERGELPPCATAEEKAAMRRVLRAAREWDADGLYDSKYCHWDDIRYLPPMSADRDFESADRVCLYLRRIREQALARSPLFSLENGLEAPLRKCCIDSTAY